MLSSKVTTSRLQAQKNTAVLCHTHHVICIRIHRAVNSCRHISISLLLSLLLTHQHIVNLLKGLRIINIITDGVNV